MIGGLAVNPLPRVASPLENRISLSRRAVSHGYAELMGRFALPLFLTQTFTNRSHPEAVEKAHRHTLSLLNRELHGNNWQRRGVIGAQSIMGIERHKSGYPHSHAVIGHPDLDLGSKEFSALRRSLKLTCEEEWGFAKLEVAKSPAHCNAYIAKYVCKDGEVCITEKLVELSRGQLSLQASAILAATGGRGAHSAAALVAMGNEDTCQRFGARTVGGSAQSTGE